MTAPLHKIPVKLLSDLISPRALERIIQDGALSRDSTPDQLTPAQLEDILKREVFRRLQHSIPAPLAKKRVIEVLKQIGSNTASPPPPRPSGVSLLPAIEESAKKFSLYFDWPETQRLRGVLGIARTEEKAGHNIEALVQEAQDLVGQMERRLEEGLVAQAQDLAELKASFTRVQSMGGKDVRRLDNLIGQIEEAQGQGTLLPAEVERARNITFKLRKSLESSVVQSLDPSMPAPDLQEAQARVQALEQEHVTRQFTDLSREFATLLRARPDLETQQAEWQQRQQAGQLTSEELETWRSTLESARQSTLTSQREELAALQTQLAELPDSPAAHDARVTLDVARLSLEGGSLATDELRELQSVARALTYSPATATRILEQQRELVELERAVREVPSASAELTPKVNAIRENLSRGLEVDMTPLWAELEQYMGEAAMQREDFDARADHVIREYDQVRSLAGETTQKLGRLAETLRAQRRLGPMSMDARERYAQTLTDAEALLAEARAEFQAAQEVTSAFGQDALSDLLDVFDFGGGGDDGAGLFGSADPAPAKAAAAAPAAPSPAPSGFDALLGLTAGAASELPAGRWVIEYGRVAQGTNDLASQSMAALLKQASQAGLLRMDMADSTHVWSARSIGHGAWRLARAQDWDALDNEQGPWLDNG